MSREITTHKVNGCNDEIRVTAEDQPGSGGAHHSYRICVPIIDPAEHHVAENSRRMRTYCDIRFQNGPIKEAGVNGITHEAMLAVIADRLECFQKEQFACDDNQEALGHVKAAMAVLKRRTEARLKRGVEGTHTV